MSPKIISIEGNIGAGKTTILQKITERYANDPSVVFLREPVDIWETIKDAEGTTILANFYMEPEKYAFSFQVMAFVTRLSLLRNAVKENPDCKLIVCERSLEADRNIFAKMLFDEGSIDDMNYQIYLRFYEEYHNDFHLDGIVYIDADADVCQRRISTRGRNGESCVPLEYLEKCKRYHDEWLLSDERPQSHERLELLHLNTNVDVKYDETDDNDMGMAWVDRIDDFMQDMLSKNRIRKSMFSKFLDFISPIIVYVLFYTNIRFV
jgi:deoxyadenosine/deoxycytidine kinase